MFADQYILLNSSFSWSITIFRMRRIFSRMCVLPWATWV